MYYVHGYLSSPDGSKAMILKDELDAIPLRYRDCEPEDLVISSCLYEIKRSIEHDDQPVVIGSSLGGFLSAEIAYDVEVSTLFLINPAVIPPDINLDSISDMPMRILKDMKDDRLFSEKIDARLIIFSATDDTVVPPEWVLRFARFQEATVLFLHDDHRLSKHLFQLSSLIRLFL